MADDVLADRTADRGGKLASDAEESHVDVVYRRLRAAILNGTLEPGSRLSQVRLAAEFEMSRGPLREALRLLEREGLIDARHRRMVRVAPTSLSELDELYALRIVNESLAVRITVPLLTEADCGALDQDLAAMDQAGADGDSRRWEDAHRRFHLRLCAGAGKRTVRLVEELFDNSFRYRSAYRDLDATLAYERSKREHRQIVDACLTRDSARGSELIARHLSRTALTLFAEGAPDHEPTRIREATRFVISSSPEPDVRGGRGRTAAAI